MRGRRRSVGGGGLEVGDRDALDLEIGGALLRLGEVVAGLHRKSHTSVAIKRCLMRPAVSAVIGARPS